MKSHFKKLSGNVDMLTDETDLNSIDFYSASTISQHQYFTILKPLLDHLTNTNINKTSSTDRLCDSLDRLTD